MVLQRSRSGLYVVLSVLLYYRKENNKTITKKARGLQGATRRFCVVQAWVRRVSVLRGTPVPHPILSCAYGEVIFQRGEACFPPPRRAPSSRQALSQRVCNEGGGGLSVCSDIGWYSFVVRSRAAEQKRPYRAVGSGFFLFFLIGFRSTRGAALRLRFCLNVGTSGWA